MHLFLLGFLACGEEPFQIDGSVNGEAFTPVTAFWGGPYIVFLDTDLDCKDMWWVQRINLEGEDPPPLKPI